MRLPLSGAARRRMEEMMMMKTMMLAAALGAACVAWSPAHAECPFDDEANAMSFGSVLAAADRCGYAIDRGAAVGYAKANIASCAQVQIGSPLATTLAESLSCEQARVTAGTLGVLTRPLASRPAIR